MSESTKKAFRCKLPDWAVRGSSSPRHASGGICISLSRSWMHRADPEHPEGRTLVPGRAHFVDVVCDDCILHIGTLHFDPTLNHATQRAFLAMVHAAGRLTSEKVVCTVGDFDMVASHDAPARLGGKVATGGVYVAVVGGTCLGVRGGVAWFQPGGRLALGASCPGLRGPDVSDAGRHGALHREVLVSADRRRRS